MGRRLKRPALKPAALMLLVLTLPVRITSRYQSGRYQ